MSYQVLYRRYRPTDFDEIIGQEQICKTLKNQISSDQISHAYLFTGTRGVGKTSAARILARAITCSAPKGGNPCKKCASCLDTNNVDIIELDGASNNSVDQAREIRDKVQYLPANGKYKVYIIDEVHMLTGSAFNALLKTLEEPPKHVVFILCTTEAQKIPPTILSRCMRFDFNLVPTSKIAALISNVFAELNVNATPEAINAIAAAGEGSVRDAFSVADRCVAFGEKLDYNAVNSILGATDRNAVYAFAENILTNNIQEILRATERLVSQGKSVGLLTKDICQAFRDMLVVRAVENPKEILMLPDDLLDRLSNIAKVASPKKLLYAMEEFSDLDTKLRFALSPRLLFEATALNVAASSGENDLDGLEARLSKLEKRGVVPLEAKSGEQPSVTKSQAPSSVKEFAERDYDKARPVWAEVLSAVREKNYPVLSTMLGQVSSVWLEGQTLAVLCNQMQYSGLTDKDNLKILKELLSPKGFGLKLIKNQDETGDDKQKQLAKIAGKIEII